MKKFTFSFLVLILLSVTLTHSYGHAQENSISDNGEKSFNELKKALKNTELEIDMTNEKYVEKEIYNDKGDEFGVMGIEEISSEPVYETPISGDFNLFAKTIPKGVNTTYKVKLQSVGVFFHLPLIVS